MAALYIITIFVLAVISFALYMSKRTASQRQSQLDPAPARFRSLFGVSAASEDSPDTFGRKSATTRAGMQEERVAGWRTRAAAGEREVLRDAQTSGASAAVYDELLATLTARAAATSVEETRALASFITQNENLRAGKTLAETLLALWLGDPDPEASAATVLHVAALSGDAGVYEKAVEAALRLWQERRISLPAARLLALLESHYWMLAPEARSSGAGFVLKETLAGARRQLTAARRATNPTEEGKPPYASEEENHEHAV